MAMISAAEDLRRAEAIPAAARASHEATVRRRVDRALARMSGSDVAPLLVAALSDEDPEAVAWAAYGIGRSCGPTDQAGSALTARLASLAVDSKPAILAKAPDSEHGGLPDPMGMDPVAGIVRALGRCGGSTAEQELLPWLSSRGVVRNAAALALADVAARSGRLAPETTAALLDAAEASPPLDEAFAPFGRIELNLPSATVVRLTTACRAAIRRPGPSRMFALRALGNAASLATSTVVGVDRIRDDGGARASLAAFLRSGEATAAERIEAIRGLAGSGPAGEGAISAVVFELAQHPLRDLAQGGRLPVLLSAIGALRVPLASSEEETLWTLARIVVPPGSAEGLVRRASQLRCAAAGKLARGAWTSDILTRCDLEQAEIGQRARIEALGAGLLVGSRRAAWLELAHSPFGRVREAALELMAGHEELGQWGRKALADALGDRAAGVVATAARLVAARPERVFATDVATPPTRGVAPGHLDASVETALGVALAGASSWPPDRVEARIDVLRAALAVGLDAGASYAKQACRDDNATLRSAAAKALDAAGIKAECGAPNAAFRAPASPAAELGRTLSDAVRIDLDTDAGMLVLRLDPTFAPIATTRLVALARAGFYTGLEFDPVVPGTVAQFGERDGDGGPGELLRSETSPVPFEPGDVGVAQKGRDTGSSQIFVTLAREPHLDGELAWIGHAEGPWDDVVEGDVIHVVRVTPEGGAAAP
jgi:cyclophilin family peptidyl-prolyl cis-trans isomerase